MRASIFYVNVKGCFIVSVALIFDDGHIVMVGFGFLDHDLEPFDIFLVAVDGKTDADVFFLGKIRVFVGFFDALEPFFHFVQFIWSSTYLA